jgi:hypothetical protein
MAKQFEDLSENHSQFIKEQKIFFVGTAASEGNVNVSPKGMDSLRVLSPKRVIWLNVTGSGNESSAHVQINPRMTIMFCAFEGTPLILRLYGKAKVIHKNDLQWGELFSHFNPIVGARQIFDLDIELVQSSCGFAVPFFDFKEDRKVLINWAEKKGDEGIKKYWEENNQITIDGMPTNIITKNI